MKKTEKKNSVFFNFPDFAFEKEFINANSGTLVAGIDEAGRGALAGPLCVGISFFTPGFISNPPENISEIINDSKRLTHDKRVKALSFIKANSLYSDSVFISHEYIDSYNVNEATRTAIIQLVEKAPVKPQLLLIDGNFRFDLPWAYRSIKRGDSLSLSIASASIVAKVDRDLYMMSCDTVYPEYSFKKNMGYGTRHHLEALLNNGPSPIHRRSYEPLRSNILDGVIR